MRHAPIGELRKLADGWELRLRVGPGSERCSVQLLGCRSEDEVEPRRRLLADMAQRLRAAGHSADAPKLLEMAAAAPGGPKLEGVQRAVDALCSGQTIEDRPREVETFKSFAEQWTSGKLHGRWPDYVKRKRTAEDDALRLAKHVYPVVGDVPFDNFTIEHADAVMAHLPADLSAASRRHVAQLMHRVLAMAVYPARLIKSNPLPRGFLPKLGKPKAFPILHPADDATLLACEAIPLEWRLLYGWLHREGGRLSDAKRLRWRDVDLEVGTIAIDEHKCDDAVARSPWKLNRGVADALATFRDVYRPDAEPHEHVFLDEHGRPITGSHMADQVRKHLEAAGLKETRPDLFTRGKNRSWFGTHCFRRSFVTLHLAAGYSETWCMDRTGHETPNMLARYRQHARTIAELELGELVPLDQAIPELSVAPSLPHKITRTSGGIGRRTGFRFRRRKA